MIAQGPGEAGKLLVEREELIRQLQTIVSETKVIQDRIQRISSMGDSRALVPSFRRSLLSLCIVVDTYDDEFRESQNYQIVEMQRLFGDKKRLYNEICQRLEVLFAPKLEMTLLFIPSPRKSKTWWSLLKIILGRP